MDALVICALFLFLILIFTGMGENNFMGFKQWWALKRGVKPGSRDEPYWEQQYEAKILDFIEKKEIDDHLKCKIKEEIVDRMVRKLEGHIERAFQTRMDAFYSQIEAKLKDDLVIELFKNRNVTETLNKFYNDKLAAFLEGNARRY